MPSAAFAARQQAYLRSLNQHDKSKSSSELIRNKFSLKKTLVHREVVEHKREESLFDKVTRLNSLQERNYDDAGSITDSLTSEDTYEDNSSTVEVEEEQISVTDKNEVEEERIPIITEHTSDLLQLENQNATTSAKEEMALVITEDQIVREHEHELASKIVVATSDESEKTCEDDAQVENPFADESLHFAMKVQEEKLLDNDDQVNDTCLVEIKTVAAVTDEEAVLISAEIQEEEIPAVCLQEQELADDLVIETPNISDSIYKDDSQAANDAQEEMLHNIKECLPETTLAEDFFATETQNKQVSTAYKQEQASVTRERKSRATIFSKPARTPKINLDEYGFKYLRKRNDAIVKLQRFWWAKRMKIQNRDFLSYASKIQVMTLTKPAVIVQSQWRKYLARRNFVMLINAVVVLQSIVRTWHCKELRDHKQAVRQHRLNAASVRIQSVYRGYSTRCLYDLDEIVYQIIILQSLVRRKQAIRTRYILEGLNYLLMESLVRKIQCAYRKHRNGSTITKRLLVQRRQDYGDHQEEDMLGLHYTDTNNLTYVIEDVEEFESKCCESSRCGFTDEVHEILMESGKWM